jgi:hypothetical protein
MPPYDGSFLSVDKSNVSPPSFLHNWHEFAAAKSPSSSQDSHLNVVFTRSTSASFTTISIFKYIHNMYLNPWNQII